MKWIMPVIFILSLLLSSCAPGEKIEPAGMKRNDDEPFPDPPATEESKKREPIFVYDDKEKALKKEIVLRMNSEPILLASGYVRLVGVVSGGRPMALMEVGGRGLAVEHGDEIADYLVAGIHEKAIKLIRREN